MLFIAFVALGAVFLAQGAIREGKGGPSRRSYVYGFTLLFSGLLWALFVTTGIIALPTFRGGGKP